MTIVSMLEKDKCLCGVSVHLATRIVSWIGVILGICNVAAGLIGVIVDTKKYGKNKNINSFTGEQKEFAENALGAVYIGFLSSLFSVVVIGLMLCGNYKKRPNFYLPYLIITGFQLAIGYIVLIIGSCALLFTAAGVAIVSPIHGLLVFVILILVIFIVAVTTYFFFAIPCRSYQSMKMELKQGRLSRNQIAPANPYPNFPKSWQVQPEASAPPMYPKI